MKHIMMKWIDRADAFVEERKEDEYVVLLNYHRFEPASAAAIAEVEEELGHPLPRVLKEFYQQTNGFQLHWILKEDLENEADHRFHGKPYDLDFRTADGEDIEEEYLNLIPPIEEFLRDPYDNRSYIREIYGEKTVELYGKTYKNLGEHIYHFDHNHSYSVPVVLLDPRDEDPLVFTASNFRIELGPPWPKEPRYLSDYLERIV